MNEEISPIQLPTLENIHQSRRPAGFWIRVVASIIDSIVLKILLLPFSFLMIILGFTTSASHDYEIYLLTSLIQAPFAFFYCAWLNKNKGGTLGKLALGLNVVFMENGQNLTYAQTFIRQLGQFINLFTFGIGWIMAGFRPDKRGLHDLIAGTQVIQTK